jgi:hypothetical protein
MAISHTFLRTAVASAAAALFLASPTHANVVFDFSGACGIGCSGTATGVLTLADTYAFGSDITFANFLSFDYSSSNLSFDIISGEVASFLGGLNADGSFNSSGLLNIGLTPGFPDFNAIPGQFTALLDDEKGDRGAVFAFTLVGEAVPGPVPEPSTWAMILLGFAGLGYAGYRRARLLS